MIPLTMDQAINEGRDAVQGLRASAKRIAFAYTALSLASPERIRFRYIVDGFDRNWSAPVATREAVYTNLPPGSYRFRVIASNSSGVWNEAGASLEFSVLPAFYQTNWFRALCGAAFLLLLWGIYRLRVQQLQHQLAIGLEARVNERTRIARELHDTLLQSLQGLMLHFQTGIDLLPRRPAEARKTLEIAVDRATGRWLQAPSSVDFAIYHDSFPGSNSGCVTFNCGGLIGNLLTVNDLTCIRDPVENDRRSGTGRRSPAASQG